MKIIIDNNIITKENIEKIKNSNILKQVKSNKMEFFACSKLFEQMFPYLIGLNEQERKETIDFTFELLNGSRILDSIGNIANKEIANARGKFQFIPCAMQKKIIRANLYSKTNLTLAMHVLNNNMPNANVAHSEIKQWVNKNRTWIKKLSEKKFADLDKNISDILTKRGFDNNATNAAIRIVKNVDDNELTTEEKKNIIFENLFFLLMEFDFLTQLKAQKKLIKDEKFFKSYYQQYYKSSFAKIMIKATLFGYSYKVCGNQHKKKYDNDWVNDTSYICSTYFADTLLTNDKTYLKDSFKWVYENKKEIIGLDEFINKYCS